jgi:hypothetical protein
MSDTLQLVVVSLAALFALAVVVRPYLPGRARRSNAGVGAPTPTCAKCAASHARPAAVSTPPRAAAHAGTARSRASVSRT